MYVIVARLQDESTGSAKMIEDEAAKFDQITDAMHPLSKRRKVRSEFGKVAACPR